MLKTSDLSSVDELGLGIGSSGFEGKDLGALMFGMIMISFVLGKRIEIRSHG